MTINALLHVHSSDDPKDHIFYSFEDVLSEAQKNNINVIALTCHEQFTPFEKYEEQAKKYGVFFISGIEKRVEGKDVLILNCKKDIELIKTFEELRIYKKNNPECFIIAPHPFFPGGYSLQENLEKNIDCFDAIELSWFYTQLFDFNKKAKSIAHKYSLPYIATPDAHEIKELFNGYISLELEQFSNKTLFDAIRNKQFKNKTKPQWLIGLIFYVFTFQLKRLF